LPEGFTLLQVTPRLEGGGVEQVTLDTAAAVVRVGGRALVASRGGGLTSTLERNGGRLIALPVDSRNPLIQAANVARLVDIIRRERVSLVHVRSRAPAFSAIPAARAARVPVVATYHGVYSAKGPMKRWYNAVMTRADLTIANSRYTRDHVAAEHGLSPGLIALATEGVDTEWFDPGRVSAKLVSRLRTSWGAEEEAPVLLLAARLTGWKGQAVAIEALARMTDFPRARLVLAGKAETPGAAEALREQAARAGVGDRVVLVGPIEDMPTAYAAADLVLAPSTEPESFGRGVAEAGAMGRVVLASPLGGPGETVVDGVTGRLVKPGDPAAWAVAITEALAAPAADRLRMGAAARAHVTAELSLDTMMSQTFAIYRRLVATTP
jgi:glycosyltransferase involved in cell wall biosynthesis